MPRRIQVGNLNGSVDDRGLTELFAPYGAIRRATVATHRHTGKSTGAGFVGIESEEEGDAAIAALDGRGHRGHVLSVCRSMPRGRRRSIEGRGTAAAMCRTDQGKSNAASADSPGDSPEAGGFGDRGGSDSTGD